MNTPERTLRDAMENDEVIIVEREDMIAHIQEKFKEKTGRTISNEDVEVIMDIENEFMPDKVYAVTTTHKAEEAGE